MENSLKGLILAAGTVITCLVITLGFYLSKEAQATAGTGTSKIEKINAEFAENDKMIYDDVQVSGNEVINAIKKFKGENIGISVTTNSEKVFYGYVFDLKTGELKSKSDKEYTQEITENSSEYINPFGTFKGKVIRNGNDVITGIIFTQV